MGISLEVEVLKKNYLYDLILGIIITVVSLLMLFDSRRLKEGLLDKQIGFVASPKGFIIMIATGLLILAILLIIQSVTRLIKPFPNTVINDKDEYVKKETMLPKEVLISMIVFTAYVATIEIFGFLVNSFVLLVILMTMFYIKEIKVDTKDRKKIIKIFFSIVIISIVSMFLIQQIFVTVLRVGLPKGIFGI